MKRTTIMIEEELLYQLKQIARQQEKPFASVVREALAVYVTEQQEQNWPENPLLAIAGIGESEEPTDMSNGRDEEILMAEIHPVYGWGRGSDGAG
jgi:predicted transcriptional regulator